MATGRSPGGGGTPTARIGFDYSSLRNAPNVAREAGRAVARELQAALKQVQREQAALENQRTAAMKAVLTQRRVAVRAAAREEAEVTRQAVAQQAAADRQRTAELKAALRQRVIAVKAAAREEAEAMRQSQVSAGAFRRGAASFAGAAFAGPLGGLAGGLAGGGPALAAGLAVSEGARRALEATQVATAYGRQEVAGVKLAYTQSRLNALLEAYSRATGGAVDEATTLANVVNLQSIGFGKSAAELERFVRAARGVSLARGRPQEEMIQEISLAIANQSMRRLDQIGLGVKEVNDRMAELRAQNQGMSREAAFQEAVLSRLDEKYGDLAKSAQGQATGTERASKAAKDLTLTIGQVLGPTVNLVGGAFADSLNIWIQRLKLVEFGAEQVAKALQGWGILATPSVNDPRSRTTIGRVTPERFRGGVQIREEHQALINQRQESLSSIDRDSVRQQNEATRQGSEQRAGIIRAYEQSIAREAQDFGRQRLNAERKHGLAILDVAQDSARQRMKWQEESERTIAKARADTAERLSEMDEDFKKDQARREKDFKDDMLSAAGRLDAIALLELRKGRARELEDAREAHKEQRSDLEEQLAERERDERDSLQRRIDEQRENDALRIEEMKAAFEESRIQEDIERGIALQRQAADHGDQLAEFDRQQGLRILQIKEQAQAQRDEINAQFEKDMDAQGIRTKAYEKMLAAQEKAATDSFDRWWKHVNDTITGNLPAARHNVPVAVPGGFASGGLVERSGWARVHAGEYVMPAPSMAAASGMGNNSRTVNANITIYGDGLNEQQVANLVVDYLEELGR